MFSELEISGDKAVKVETENPLNTSHKCYKKMKFSLSKPWRHIERVEVWLYSLLISAIDGGESQMLLIHPN